MVKKITQSGQRKIKTRFQAKQTTNEELKTIAIKKIRQLQNGKKALGKISKKSFEQTEKRRQQTRVQKWLFEQILDQSLFQCPVCLQLMIEPTLLECGHAYCFKCLEELMIYKSCCGVCRNVQNQAEFQRSKHLQTMIESMILKKSQNYLEYYCRVTDTENWKKVRNIPIQQLTKGGYIDFRDKQLKWRKAQILKLTYNQITELFDIVVKYKKDGQIVEQMIQSDSGRYAKFSYYTRMKYLDPRSNCNTMMEQFAQGEVMDIPFFGIQVRDHDEEIDIMEMIVQYADDIEPSMQPNISAESQTYFENYYMAQNELLDSFFSNDQIQPVDLIQLLA